MHISCSIPWLIRLVVPTSTTINSEFKSCEMPFSYLISKNSLWACAGSSQPAFQVQSWGQFARALSINTHHPHLKHQLFRGVTHTWARLLQHSRGNSTEPVWALNNSVSEWNNPRCKSLYRAAHGWQGLSLFLLQAEGSAVCEPTPAPPWNKTLTN